MKKYVFGYLRASTAGQDAARAKKALRAFAQRYNQRVAEWYIENKSGTTINRPELLRLLNDAGWKTLRRQIADKQLSVVSLDLPTSHMAISSAVTDAFTGSASLKGNSWGSRLTMRSMN